MGIWAQLKDLIVASLQFFYGWTHDYGFAIILLTVAMRLVLVPLTVKQTHSMYEMQRVQPKLKELQAKYKNNKEKQQEEMLKFYQENKVNPFGGCLPLLLQMPIFIALFQVLREHEGLGRFWIILSDLNQTPQAVFQSQGLVHAIPYLLFVVLFGLSTWLPQQMMPGDKQQKQMGLYMSAVMLWFGWISPAGVLVYWVTSSTWQIGQQMLTLRLYAKREGA